MTPEENKIYVKLLEVVGECVDHDRSSYIPGAISNLHSFINAIDLKENGKCRDCVLTVRLSGIEKE